MQKILVEEFGDPGAVCKIVPQETAPLPATHLRVALAARPINPSDLIPITGAYRARLMPPFVPGFEGVGRVTQTGTDSTGFAIGDRVLPLGKNGTWASEIIADPDWCVRVPDEFPDEVAAQLYINPATAWWIMTRELDLKPEDSIVVNACGSAISRIFLDIARAQNLRFVAIVRGPERIEEWRALGADTVLDRDRDDIAASLRDLVRSHSLRAGFDAIGGEDGKALALGLPSGATLVHYGLLSGIPLPGDLQMQVAEGVGIKLFWLRNIVHAMDPEGRKQMFNDLFRFVADHSVDLPVEARYELSQISAALAHDKRSKRTGKILLTGG